MATLEERIAKLERRIAALEGRGNGAVVEDQPKYIKVTDREPRVGDYVKFDEAPRSYLTAGKYYEIVEIDDFGDPQIIDNDGDEFDTYGFEFEVYELVAEGAPKFEVGDAEDLAKATDEEIRWAKIGRKPGEFKNGDIVRVIKDRPHGSEKRIGDIDEITIYNEPDSFCVGEGAGWMSRSDVELICPVEHRFDREGVNA
jgi:hypothetical protein